MPKILKSQEKIDLKVLDFSFFIPCEGGVCK